jgi:hypothetical protein
VYETLDMNVCVWNEGLVKVDEIRLLAEFEMLRFLQETATSRRNLRLFLCPYLEVSCATHGQS